MRKLLLGLFFIASTLFAGVVAPAYIALAIVDVAITLTASRTSCAAPCAVFFSGVGTRSLRTPTDYPFHDIEYVWDFGDPASGSWGTTVDGTGAAGAGSNTSRNVAYGPVAAHVFEPTVDTTYVVSLTAYDGTYTTIKTVQIAVTAADTTSSWLTTGTTCFYTDTLGTGCPTGATQTQATDFNTVLAALTDGRRVLLKRGNTFTGAASDTTLNVTGPAMLGAYGSGAAPKVAMTTSGTKSVINPGAISDLRIVDVEIDGSSSGAQNYISSSTTFHIDNLLLLRNYIHDNGGGVELPSARTVSGVSSGVFFVDSSIRRLRTTTGTGHGLLMFASNQAILGNLFDDSTLGANAEHMIRIPFAKGLVVSNNQIQLVKATKEMISLRGPCTTSTCPNGDYGAGGVTGTAAETQYGVISDNYIISNQYASIHITAVASGDSVVVKDIIIERNKIIPVAGGGLITRIASSTDTAAGVYSFITMRNNLLNMTATAIHDAFLIYRATTAWIYNNTAVSAGGVGATDDYIFAQIKNSSVTLKNNLFYAPIATGDLFYQDFGGNTITASNNSTDTPALGTIVTGTNPWSSTPTTTASTWRPVCTGTTYPCRQGTTKAAVPVWSDFLLTRPHASNNRTLGAVTSASP